MKAVVYFLLNFFLLFGAAVQAAPFRISLNEVPRNWDPHEQRSSSGGYLLQQLYRNFYKLGSDGKITGDLGEGCTPQNKKWLCKIKDNSKWSDGSAITAQDFQKSWLRVLTRPAPRANLLFSIKNAEDIFKKQKPLEALGLQVLDEKTFSIEWTDPNRPDPTLLLSPLFVPVKNGEWKKNTFFSGPYIIKTVTSTQIELLNNIHYPISHPRPEVHFILLDESLMVQAFIKNQLDFVRRVPTSQIPQFKKDPRFLQVETLRFDSLFFGPQLKNEEPLRKNLITTLNYKELQSLLNSESLPGCVGLPLSFYSGPELCVTSTTPNSQNSIQTPQNSDPKKTKPAAKLKKYDFLYSALGGEDHRRLSEWLQSQWSNLIQLEVRGMENKIFLSRLQQQRPALFRRGISPEFPSCSSLLKIFQTTSSDNISEIKDAKIDQALNELQNSEDLLKGPHAKSQKLCRKTLELILNQNQSIPTGRIFMSFLLNPNWKGVEINSLNHLNLSLLKKVSN
ncbi:MAG: ABC transporter substrate-binding protein [Bdellovibrionales bacterium]